LLLAVYQKALPALPFSIFLGIAFFFLSKAFLLPLLIYLGSQSVFI
jgi:presenilin 1